MLTCWLLVKRRGSCLVLASSGYCCCCCCTNWQKLRQVRKLFCQSVRTNWLTANGIEMSWRNADKSSQVPGVADPQCSTCSDTLCLSVCVLLRLLFLLRLRHWFKLIRSLYFALPRQFCCCCCFMNYSNKWQMQTHTRTAQRKWAQN